MPYSAAPFTDTEIRKGGRLEEEIEWSLGIGNSLLLSRRAMCTNGVRLSSTGLLQRWSCIAPSHLAQRNVIVPTYRCAPANDA